MASQPYILLLGIGFAVWIQTQNSGTHTLCSRTGTLDRQGSACRPMFGCIAEGGWLGSCGDHPPRVASGNTAHSRRTALSLQNISNAYSRQLNRANQGWHGPGILSKLLVRRKAVAKSEAAGGSQLAS